MSRTIRWGIIGCGNVTEKKSGPGFQKATNSELIAVMRRTPGKAEDYARRHDVPKWYDDADKLINDPDVDVVYIATPPETHKEYTLRVAAAGKPVYVEKPMARSYEECQDMIGACKKKGIPLFVAYYRRSLPKFLKVKEILDSDIIGKPQSVSVILTQMPQADQYSSDPLPWRIIPEKSGGGYFFDLASHTFDLLDYYFGPVTSVHGIANNHMNWYPAEDNVSATFLFQNAVTGAGLWCFTTTIEEDRIEIFGENGTISFSTFSRTPITIQTNGKKDTINIEPPTHIQQPHIQSVVDELVGGGICPSTGDTAARTSWVMDQIIKDWRSVKGIKF